MTPAELARLDARISRCNQCGGWQWDNNCRMCWARTAVRRYEQAMQALHRREIA